MGRDLFAERESHDQPHPDKIMGHGCLEIEAVTGEIHYLPHVLNLRESSVKRPHVHWEGYFEALPGASVLRGLGRWLDGGLELRPRSCSHIGSPGGAHVLPPRYISAMWAPIGPGYYRVPEGH